MSGVIYGCYGKLEAALAFNQQGPKGDTGARGLQGETGPRGLQGEPGKDGIAEFPDTLPSDKTLRGAWSVRGVNTGVAGTDTAGNSISFGIPLTTDWIWNELWEVGRPYNPNCGTGTPQPGHLCDYLSRSENISGVAIYGDTSGVVGAGGRSGPNVGGRRRGGPVLCLRHLGGDRALTAAREGGSVRAGRGGCGTCPSAAAASTVAAATTAIAATAGPEPGRTVVRVGARAVVAAHAIGAAPLPGVEDPLEAQLALGLPALTPARERGVLGLPWIAHGALLAVGGNLLTHHRRARAEPLRHAARPHASPVRRRSDGATRAVPTGRRRPRCSTGPSRRPSRPRATR